MGLASVLVWGNETKKLNVEEEDTARGDCFLEESFIANLL